ncbi:helix-hairpin-helix domain-containing protein, partial [Candidatus Riflebacteria bacterium]
MIKKIFTFFVLSLLILSVLLPDQLNAKSHHSEGTVENRIDLNTGTIEDLVNIRGVGRKSAQRIIDYRKKHGPFKNIKDLMKVKGFGARSFNKIKDKLRVSQAKPVSENKESNETARKPVKEEKKETDQQVSSRKPGTVDINTAAVNELSSIRGIGNKSAQRIIDYREKHGPFKSIRDLIKVRGFGAKSFAKIESKIWVSQISAKKQEKPDLKNEKNTIKPKEKEEEKAKVESKPGTVDINTADVSGLSSIRGIGKKSAQRIIDYRKKYGPFKNVKDLIKVKGFGGKSFAKIESKIRVGQVSSKKQEKVSEILASSPAKKKETEQKVERKPGTVDINTANAIGLSSVRGIGKRGAKRIIAYRKKHGLFKTIEDLMKVKGFGPKSFKKIRNKIWAGTEAPVEEPEPVEEPQKEEETDTVVTPDADAVDLNAANVAVFSAIKGIGKKSAQRIIDYREKHGSFKVIADIKKVLGFGKKSFQKIKRKILVDSATAATFDKEREKRKSKKPAAVLPVAPVDLNSASRDELIAVKGIGYKTASRIIEYRESTGPFKTINELIRIKGFPREAFEKLKTRIKVSSKVVQKRVRKKTSTAIPESIKIGSFNIRLLSNSSRSDKELGLIVDLIQDFDLVAIQELRDAAVLKRLVKILNKRGHVYKHVVSPKVGRGVKELYAYVYKKGTVKLLHGPFVYSEKGDEFIREPYYAYFKAGNFDFYLVTIHVFWGKSKKKRRPEIRELA